MNKNLTEIMNTDALEFARYSVEKRALASIIDGLKPVQRFFLYSTIKNAKNNFKKVASIAGPVSDYGYHHGEVSAQDAGKLMGAAWTNNIPIIEGQGNFGSRMVNDSGAARYVHAKLHDNFETYFKDIHLSPEHPEKEHMPPKFYVPVIPMILVNGVKGVATGFACEILPHDPEWVKLAVESYVKTGKIQVEWHHSTPIKFPEFSGIVKQDKINPLKYTQHGVFTCSGLTVTITDIPTKYDHEKYCAILDALRDKGVITSWADETSDEFRFIVKMKRGQDMSPEAIEKALKLTSSYTQNLNVIDVDGKLIPEPYKSVHGIIRDFCDYRMTFLQTRIIDGIATTSKNYALAEAKVKFITLMNDDTIKLKGFTRAKAVNHLVNEHGFDKVHAPVLLNMRVDQMTSDEVKKLEKEAKDIMREYTYWTKTNTKKEFLKDLKEL